MNTWKLSRERREKFLIVYEKCSRLFMKEQQKYSNTLIDNMHETDTKLRITRYFKLLTAYNKLGVSLINKPHDTEIITHDFINEV